MGEARVSLATKLHYAVGDIGNAILMSATNFFLMIFLTDVALVAPAIASSALLLGKIWDTINSPLFGYVTDRTRSRHGRRRVYLIYGAAPLAVLAALVWMIPAGLSPAMAFLCIALTYSLYDTALTMVRVPYMSLGAEIVKDYDERTSLVAITALVGLVGVALGSVLMPLIVKLGTTPKAGYAMAGTAFGLLAGACTAWVAWHIREPKSNSQPSAVKTWTPWSSVRVALRCRPFVLLAVGSAVGRLGLALFTGSLAYFVTYQLKGSRADVSKFLVSMLWIAGLSLPLWKKFAERWEKNFVYAIALLLSAAGFAWQFCLRPGQLGSMWGAVVLIGLGMGGKFAVPGAMLPDTIDFADAQDGEPPTGTFYGLFDLCDKLARTLSLVALGGILQAFHYVPNAVQSRESLLGIRLVSGLLPALCVLLALPLLLVYPISRSRHAALRAARLSLGSHS